MSQITEQQVRDYLMAHPEWLEAQDGLFFSGRRKIKDFREAQLAKAQADKQLLAQRQQQWLTALKTNQTLSRLLWESAATLARANGYQAVIQALDSLLHAQLDFPAYAVKLVTPYNKRPVPVCLQTKTAWQAPEVKSYSHLPHSMSTWFEHLHASFLVLPIVYQEQQLGVWVVASNQAGYFHPELDTTYLEAYVQVLAATLARIMGVAVSC